jgi:hypothetical protein
MAEALLSLRQTGMHTEMGKIADALNQTKDESTPLQIKLNELGKKLSWLVIFICIFIFVFDLVMAGEFTLTRDPEYLHDCGITGCCGNSGRTGNGRDCCAYPSVSPRCRRPMPSSAD